MITHRNTTTVNTSLHWQPEAILDTWSRTESSRKGSP